MTPAEEETLRTGFYTELRALLADGIDPNDVARILVEKRKYRPYVITLVAQKVRGEVREDTRIAEREVATDLSRRQFKSAAAQLVGRSFALPDGRIVEWKKATAVDHRLRAEWFGAQIGSLEQTRALHVLAARLIEDAKVECLGQIRSIRKWSELASAVGAI